MKKKTLLLTGLALGGLAAIYYVVKNTTVVLIEKTEEETEPLEDNSSPLKETTITHKVNVIKVIDSNILYIDDKGKEVFNQPFDTDSLVTEYTDENGVIHKFIFAQLDNS